MELRQQLLVCCGLFFVPRRRRQNAGCKAKGNPERLDGDVNVKLDTPEALARFLNIDDERLHGPLNLVEAAPMLGIAPSTLRQHALARHIGHMRIGRAWRFTWQDLAAFVEEHHVDALPSEVGVPAGRGPTRRVRSSRRRDGRIPDHVMEDAKRLGLL